MLTSIHQVGMKENESETCLFLASRKSGLSERYLLTV